MNAIQRAQLNADVNYEITYHSDGESDYWQSPDKTMWLRRGDCEDIAIEKARRIGVAKCSLLIGHTPSGGHAVCRDDEGYCYDLHGGPKQLDDMNNFTPLLELFFDARPAFDYGMDPRSKLVLLTKWQDLIDRMVKEGTL